MHHEMSTHRRLALRTALAVAAVPLGGCSWLPKPGPLRPVCPNDPAVSFLEGQLTVDAHCHVFNGTDLQVEEFLARIAVRQDGPFGSAARALGDLLEKLAWKYAPTGDEELRRLREAAETLQSCSSKGQVPGITTLRQDGYQRGRAQLQAALEQSAALRAMHDKRSQSAQSFAADSDDAARLEALALIESLPDTAEAYQAQRQGKSLRAQSLASLSVQGLIDFVLQNFQYRYVSVHDYLATYNRPGNRVVDLMLPSMVDYDFCLKQGSSTLTPLATQVEVMRNMSIVTGGRVHGFVPFDPLRQVAFELGQAQEDSLALAQRAVRDQGCVGVKLYPPMGFAALGNVDFDGKGFWKQKWLPWWADRNDLGSRLDRAMRQLFDWCQAEQVPVMAHTSESNGPSTEFEALTDAKYWSKALAEFPSLRVNFGHFGGSSPVAKGLARARSFASLMNTGLGASGSDAYADAGYFVEVVGKEPAMEAVIRKLYEETSSKAGAALANRFIYGTDWEMTLTEGSVNTYLEGFERLFADLEAQPVIKASGLTGLAARFFGLNAAAWVGLARGQPARGRLDRFYGAHRIATPDWAVKLDRLTTTSN